MLPTVLTEGEFSQFHFWLDDDIQDGILYQGEMFCRLFTVSSTYRAQLYHYACRLFKQESIVITMAEGHCSLWISLRSPNLAIFREKVVTESFMDNVAHLAVD